MDDKYKIGIAEAKDLLKDVDIAVTRAREKSWQLILLTIGVNIYIFQFYLQEKQTPLVELITCVVVPFSIAIFFMLYKSVTPSNRGFLGINPKDYKLIDDLNDDEAYQSIMNTYRIFIRRVEVIQIELVKCYTQALGSFCLMVSISFIVTAIFLFIKR